jgi:hypothetical protein
MGKVFCKWISLVLILLLGVGAATVQADVYMKQKRRTSAMKVMGYEKPAEDVIEEIWITREGYRSSNDKTSIIMRFDQSFVISVDHQTKTYMEIPLSMEDMMKEVVSEKDRKEAEVMKGMMEGMMKSEIAVKVTNDWKDINGWKSRKYLLSIKTFMGEMVQEIWATEELNIDKNLYDRFSSTLLAGNPSLKDAVDDMMREMKKIKGVQVRNIFTQKIMNQNISTTTDLIEFRKGKAPSGILELPSGYRKKKLR